MQVQLSDEELVRRVNRKLLPALRQSAVHVQFSEPVSLPLLQDLTLVRLHESEESRSEDKRYLAKLSDPQWHSRIRCHVCGGAIRLVGPDVYVCKDGRCVMATQKVAKLSHRGVVSVMWNRSFVARYDQRTWQTPRDTGILIDVQPDGLTPHTAAVPMLGQCIAMLDRRYDAVAIAAVYRTIGALADQKGWRLKNPE